MNKNSYYFSGPYGELCLQFIQYKRSLGYKYGARSVRAMKELNQYLAENEDGSEGTALTKATVLGYTNKRDGEEPMTRQGRESFIRQFAIYLNSLGIPAYVAPIRKKERSTFTPYIFTRRQICDILKAADSMRYEYRSPNHHYVYPFLLRLLYCCGLRISEALSLDIQDIDFDEKVLKIKQAKYNNSRLVPISDSLFTTLEKYMQQVGYSRDSTDYCSGTDGENHTARILSCACLKNCWQKQEYPAQKMAGYPDSMMSAIPLQSIHWN